MPRVDNESFYAASLQRYGISAQGVHWRSEHHQQIRFNEIASLLRVSSAPVRIVDAGCGFGDLYDYLSASFKGNFAYCGIDVMEAMVQIARKKTRQRIYRLNILEDPLPEADFYVCSGALNILTPHESERFIMRCFESSREGFVFNFLEGEDASTTYNYLTAVTIESIAQKMGARCVFRRGYLRDDCTAAMYKTD